jgi:hypothetical protein
MNSGARSLMPTTGLWGREEFEARHRTLEQKGELEAKGLADRMDAVANSVNLVNGRLIKIESRGGYVSLTFVLSVISILVTMGMGLLSFLRLASAVK